MTIKLRTAAALLAAALPCSARAAIPVSACDAPAMQSLSPDPGGRFGARAVWLDRRLAKWPGADASGVFKLYHSREARINATGGRPVTGAGGAQIIEEAERPS
ncbi:hypothetical protein [Massilia horti]|uniref:Pullulanase N2 domain-containing protein n=1 Tax=Massilia horti TaxID=2562153 RepID=A0A4Y9SPW4_9BURK|nr:hypothetical protein [Massilia horti]TFW27517.1 hypothetical protein E4O92_23715 [Massilia horti]